MKLIDVILLALIAAAVFFAARHICRRNKIGCTGCCASCGHACGCRQGK